MTPEPKVLLDPDASRNINCAMPAWTKAAENLVRHSGGVIYLRIKLNGKTIRKSLQTTDLRTAKMKRATEIEALRKIADGASDATPIRLLGDAVDLEEASTLAKPRLKAATIHYYRQIFASLRSTLPLRAPAATWSAEAAKAWWLAYGTAMSPSRANNALAIVQRIAATLIERSIRSDNPTKGLRRLRLPTTRLDDLPNSATLDAIIADIRGQKKRCSQESANMVGFLAWSGMRIAEMQALQWDDIGSEWITITGGETGTKNHRVRRIPVNSRLRDLIEKMRHSDAAGPVFHMRSPRLALENACGRFKIRHMRIHDLRHYFATWAIETGVDIPTVSRWLGHQDGGVLAMRTYGHLRDQHSLDSASKLN